jgi:hypothetical protein
VPTVARFRYASLDCVCLVSCLPHVLFMSCMYITVGPGSGSCRVLGLDSFVRTTYIRYHTYYTPY